MYLFILVFFSQHCIAINLCDVAVFWPLTSNSPTLNEKLAADNILKTTTQEADPFFLKISDDLSQLKNPDMKYLVYKDKYRKILLRSSLKENTFTVSIDSLNKISAKEGEQILNAANTKHVFCAILRAYLLKLQENPKLELRIMATDVRNDKLKKLIEHMQFEQNYNGNTVPLLTTFIKTITGANVAMQNATVTNLFMYLSAMLTKKYVLFTHPGNNYFITIKPTDSAK
jgi:hypothetical protein